MHAPAAAGRGGGVDVAPVELGLDPELLAPLHAGLDQIHEQLIANGSLPRPPGRQIRWAD